MGNNTSLIKKTIYKFRFLIPLIVIAAIALCYYYLPLDQSQRITLISAFVVAGSLIYSLITIEGNERTFTYSICADWYKTDLNKYHVNIFYFTSDKEIEDLIDRFIAKNLNTTDEEKFQKMVSILNYLQMVATFYLSEKVDKSIVRDNFKHIIIRYYNKFEKLINYYNDNNENKPLLELHQLYKKFKPSDKR